MMKNKMMRAASILLVAVLLSTCAISGTFAKYVTTASGTDTARVAKWGIVMDNTGSAMFQDTYYAGPGNTNPDVNGAGTGDQKVVAPGTSGLSTYTISGTPETDYKISFSYKTGNNELKDVYLGKGTYSYNNAGTNGKYDNQPTTVTENDTYYPIKYKIVIETSNGTVDVDIPTATGEENVATTLKPYTQTPANEEEKAKYTLTDITSLENAMKQLAATTIAFENNEECDVKVTLSWDWAFEQGKDLYDTILGELAVGNASDLTAADAEYSTEIKFTLIMTATQTN